MQYSLYVNDLELLLLNTVLESTALYTVDSEAKVRINRLLVSLRIQVYNQNMDADPEPDPVKRRIRQ